MEAPVCYMSPEPPCFVSSISEPFGMESTAHIEDAIKCPRLGPDTNCSFTVRRDCWQGLQCGAEVRAWRAECADCQHLWSRCLHPCCWKECRVRWLSMCQFVTQLCPNKYRCSQTDWADDCSRGNLNCLVVGGSFKCLAAHADINQVLWRIYQQSSIMSIIMVEWLDAIQAAFGWGRYLIFLDDYRTNVGSQLFVYISRFTDRSCRRNYC